MSRSVGVGNRLTTSICRKVLGNLKQCFALQCTLHTAHCTLHTSLFPNIPRYSQSSISEERTENFSNSSVRSNCVCLRGWQIFNHEQTILYSMYIGEDRCQSPAYHIYYVYWSPLPFECRLLCEFLQQTTTKTRLKRV